VRSVSTSPYPALPTASAIVGEVTVGRGHPLDRHVGGGGIQHAAEQIFSRGAPLVTRSVTLQVGLSELLEVQQCIVRAPAARCH
jgi:hypothetical protein